MLQNLAKSASLLLSAAPLSEDLLLALRMSAVLDGTEGRGDSRGRRGGDGLLSRLLTGRLGDGLLLLAAPSLMSEFSI